MKANLTRRGFLKFFGIASTAVGLPTFHLKPAMPTDLDLPNILILVYDALSARNISIYGYPRETTPNLKRFAEQSIVFHRHFASGNYTFPGTTSLLTGTYPWTHRGFNQYRGIDPHFHNQNIFKAFAQYHRKAYSHNSLANNLFSAMKLHIDEYIPRNDLFLSQINLPETLFKDDANIAWISWWLAIEKFGTTYSPFLSRIISTYKKKITAEFNHQYPRGLPSEEGHHFLLETATDWTINTISSASEPLLSYIHYFPPHDPYHTRKEFVDAFLDDDYQPVEKDEHIFSQGFSPEYLAYKRRMYDEYVLYADAEFGRIFDHLERSGKLENTIVIVTSDHGEMFERGIERHFYEGLHLPVVQIPLLIRIPGQTGRQDITTSTSAVDILPTLLHLTDKEIPDWVEGEVLPPFSVQEPNRAVFAVEAKNAPLEGRIFPVSLMIVKDGYKLTYYDGWERQGDNTPIIELYAIEDDPEELNNLADDLPEVREALLAEVLAKAGL